MPSVDVRGSESKKLRMHIVEMAGKHGPEKYETKLENQTRSRHFKMNHLDTSVHIREHLAELDANNRDFSRKQNRIIRRKADLIDLDIAKPQNLSGHQQPHIISSSAVYSQKEKASVWLKKQFRKGHDPGRDLSPREDFTRGRSAHQRLDLSLLHVDDPHTMRQARVSSAAPDSRGFSKQLNSWDVSNEEYLLYSPTTHFPSTDTSNQADSQVRYKYGDICDSSRCIHINDSGNVRVCSQGCLDLYEVKGNALAVPVPRQQTPRRVGLFSASLEAFKRRLKLSSNKYSQRLHHEDSNLTEDYVIRVKDARKATSRTKTENCLSRSGGRRPQPPSQPLHAVHSPRLTSGQRILPRDIPELSTTHDTSTGRIASKTNGVEHPSLVKKSRGHRDKHAHPGVVDSQSPRDIHSSQEPTKFSYRLPEGSEIKISDSVDALQQTLPSVKTYVLENEQTRDASNVPRCSPLTMHNVRMHNSLHNIKDKRMKRIVRYHHQQQQLQEPQQQNQQLNDSFSSQSTDSADTTTTDRIRKWLSDVMDTSTLEPVMAVQVSVDKLSTPDLTPMVACSNVMVHDNSEIVFV